MKHALTAGDVKSLARLAHGLKGSSAALGALRLSQLCGPLSQIAPGDDLKECSARLQAIGEEYGRVEVELQEIPGCQPPRKTSSACR